MQAQLQNINPTQAGYAWLVLSQMKSLPIPGDANFIVQRASDRKFLGDNGWQEEQVLLTPLVAQLQDEDLYLKIGPQIVDSLDLQANYRLYLSCPGQALQMAGLQITDITYSTLKQQEDIKSQLAQQEAASNASEPVETAWPETNSADDSTPTRQQQQPEQQPEPWREAEQYPQQPPTYHEMKDQQEEDQTRSVSSVLMGSIGLIAVMFCIGLLMYFFL